MDSSLSDDFTEFMVKRVDSVKAGIKLSDNIIALEKTNSPLFAAITGYANLVGDRSYKQGLEDAINMRQIFAMRR